MVYVLLGTGFEDVEAITPIDLLRRAGIAVLTVGLNGKIVTGGHGIGIEADITIDEMDLTDLEMIVLPGGLGGVASIQNCAPAMDAIRFAHENNKYIAAICAAPTILGKLGLTQQKTITCYPGCEAPCEGATIAQVAAVRDGMLITGTSAGCAIAFALQLISVMAGQEAADKVQQQIVIR